MRVSCSKCRTTLWSNAWTLRRRSLQCPSASNSPRQPGREPVYASELICWIVFGARFTKLLVEPVLRATQHEKLGVNLAVNNEHGPKIVSCFPRSRGVDPK